MHNVHCNLPVSITKSCFRATFLNDSCGEEIVSCICMYLSYILEAWAHTCGSGIFISICTWTCSWGFGTSACT